MTVRVYRYTDPSAPVLNGNIGSMINLLDACLVNGYGTQAAAGWTKPFSGTGLAAYRQGAGNMRYLYMNDSGVGVNTTPAGNSQMTGYESMSSISAGVGPFPNAGQSSSYFMKDGSSSLQTNTRYWTVVATEKAVWVVMNPTINSPSSSSTFSYTNIWFFGDFESFKVGDQYNTLMMGLYSSSYTACCSTANTAQPNTWYTACCTPRAYHQMPGSCMMNKHRDLAVANVAAGNSPPFFVSPVDGTTIMSRYTLADYPSNTLRGIIPGFYRSYIDTASSSQFPLGYQTTITSGPLAGKTLEAFYVQDSAGVLIWLEVSDTW